MAALMCVAVWVPMLAACGNSDTRSVRAFCTTYQEQKHEYLATYASGPSSGGDSIGSLMSSIGNSLAAVGDWVVIFDKLDRVAPPDIEPDVAHIRDSLKEQQQAAEKAVDNPLGALASGLASGLMASGSWNRVSAYVDSNCGGGAGSGSGTTIQAQPSSAAASPSEASPAAGSDREPGNGLIGLDCTEGQVVRIDVANGAETPIATLQTSLTTPFDQLSLEQLACSGSIDPSGRYIALTGPQQSDGSQHVGYFDTSTGRVTDVTAATTSADGGFSSSPPTDSGAGFLGSRYLTFSRTDKHMLYDLRSGKLSSLKQSSFPSVVSADAPVGASGTVESGTTFSDLLEFDTIPAPAATVAYYADNPDNYEPPALYLGRNLSEVDTNRLALCNPQAWIDDQTLICTLGDDNSNFELLKITSRHLVRGCESCWDSGAIGPFWQGTVSGPTKLLPANNRTVANPVASADKASFVFLATQGDQTELWEGSLKHPGTAPSKIGPVTGKLVLLSWS
jgi:hypothetical protein